MLGCLVTHDVSAAPLEEASLRRPLAVTRKVLFAPRTSDKGLMGILLVSWDFKKDDKHSDDSAGTMGAH